MSRESKGISEIRTKAEPGRSAGRGLLSCRGAVRAAAELGAWTPSMQEDWPGLCWKSAWEFRSACTTKPLAALCLQRLEKPGLACLGRQLVWGKEPVTRRCFQPPAFLLPFSSPQLYRLWNGDDATTAATADLRGSPMQPSASAARGQQLKPRWGWDCPKKACRMTRATRQERILKNKKFKERTEEEPAKQSRNRKIQCCLGLRDGTRGETPRHAAQWTAWIRWELKSF